MSNIGKWFIKKPENTAVKLLDVTPGSTKILRYEEGVEQGSISYESHEKFIKDYYVSDLTVEDLLKDEEITGELNEVEIRNIKMGSSIKHTVNYVAVRLMYMKGYGNLLNGLRNPA